MPVVSAAALKGDHFDALSRQEGRRQTVGIYIDSSSKLAGKLSRACLLYVSRFLDEGSWWRFSMRAVFLLDTDR